MYKQTLNLLLLACVMTMTACSLTTKTPSTPQYLAPIVECQESKPATAIDAAPKMEREYYMQLSLEDKNTYLKKHLLITEFYVILFPDASTVYIAFSYSLIYN